MHIDTSLIGEVLVTMPEKQGIYEIPIFVYERKIGVYKDKLIIETIE